MEIINVITVEDYKQYFINTKQSTSTIQSAINLTFLQLDSICSQQISGRWNITNPKDPLYLNDTQKDYIKRAFIIQTQYNISNNMDYSQGSEMYSMGSNSYSNTRPMREQINKLVYELLQKAGVYYNNDFTTTSYLDNNCNFDATMLNINDFITYDVGDLRYILAHQDKIRANTLVSFNQNGDLTFINIPKKDRTNILVYTKKVPMNNNNDPEVYGGLKRNDNLAWMDDPDLAPYYTPDYYLEFWLDNIIYLPIIYLSPEGNYTLGKTAEINAMKIAQLEYSDYTHYSITAKCGSMGMFNGTFETSWYLGNLYYLGTYTYYDNGQWKTALVMPEATAGGNDFINVDVIVKVWKKA